MVITAVIAAQCLGQHHRGHQRWPVTPVPQFGQASPITGQTGDTVRIQDERHALRRRLFAPITLSAHALASARSRSLIGPISASSSAR